MLSATDPRSSTSRDAAVDAGISAAQVLLSTVLLAAILGRRRVREVEPEIVATDAGPADAVALVEPTDGAADESADEPEAEEPDPPAAPDVAVPPPLPVEPLDEAPEETERADVDDQVRAGAPEIAPSISTREWICEIAYWHGYDHTVFYARTYHDGEEVTIAESLPFSAVDEGAPERTQAAVAAHETLSAQLVADGWERIALGDPWYGDVFRRDFSVAGLTASLMTRITFTRRP